MSTLTVDALRASHPEVAAALIEEGRQQALAQARSDGMTAERSRIQALEALRMPGNEALVSAAIADGQTTAQDVAMRIIARQRAILEGPRRAAEAQTLAARKGIDFTAAYTQLFGNDLPGGGPETSDASEAEHRAKQERAAQAQALAVQKGLDFVTAYRQLFGNALA